jgi:PAS domain S-box-containing protein
MSLVVERVATKVREDYERFTLSAAGSHVAAILDGAASELTAARLGGNPVVVEVKQAAVRSSILATWKRAGLEGVVLGGDGRTLASTLDPGDTAAVAGGRRDGFFVVDGARGALHCVAQPFRAWAWTVVTASRRSALGSLRPELALLLPVLTLAAVALTVGVLLLLWRNLQKPVAGMAADVEADREVHPTGLEELDRIGAAVNTAVSRLRVRSKELAEELERRRAAERSLREKEMRIRLLLESTAEGIFGLDVDGTCTFCNPAALRLLGHAREEDLLGQAIHRVVHAARPDGSAYPDETCPVLRTARSGKGARIDDEVFWRKDGSSFPVEYWSYPMLEDGALRGAVVGFIDITDRATLEHQLRQAQKMEAVGRLAGGIAHDFNNVLMAILGHAMVAREAVPEGSEVRGDLEQILAAGEKAASLTRRILAFSRKQAITLAPVDLNEVVLGLGKTVARLLGDDVEVTYRLEKGELAAMADRAQIEQVLLNLWTNARDAMPEGGRLAISTQAVDASAGTAAALGLEAAGRYAAIAVTDTGVGMDERTRLRIFEPFFTTKGQGKGTGLGLSIVYGIVKQHHGHIDVASTPGLGTTVRIYLPLTERPVARPAPAPEQPVRGGTETVLLAEDNDEVRGLARAVLENAGYRVLVARDGEEAVKLHDAHGADVAICLFDVVMPRLGGREALEVLRAHRPGMRALLMSGYVPDDDGAARPGVGAAALLAKPFTPRELLRRLREALDA